MPMGRVLYGNFLNYAAESSKAKFRECTVISSNSKGMTKLENTEVDLNIGLIISATASASE